MGSKRVEDRKRSSTAVQAAVRNHLHAIARGLAELFGEETGPAIAVLLDRAVEKLAEDTAAMIRADDIRNSGCNAGRIVDAANGGRPKAAEEARLDAIERYDRTFSVTAHLVSTLLAVAGEKDLACELRPSAERAGRTAALDRDSGELGPIPFET
jgi:hypothetical protein